MKKDLIINYFKEKGLYIVQPKDTKRLSELLSLSLKKYPMIEFFFGNYDEDNIKLFFDVTAKVMVSECITIADSEDLNSIIGFCVPPDDSVSTMSYLKCGAYKFIRFGLFNVIRISKYLSDIDGIMKKYKKQNDFYIFFLATNPDMQRRGLASKLMKTVESYVDENNCGIYLETNLELNSIIYKKLGFELEEVVDVKNSNNMKLYAMYYNKNKFENKK